LSNDQTLFLIDGSAYIFRAYHGLPPLTRKSDGLPVGAVSGFCNMLWKLLVDARDTAVGVVPTHFAVIFDYSSKTFRNTLYSGYKANRTAPPDDLVPQFGLIRQATRAFGLPCIEQEGIEADDIIATYARMMSEAGGATRIISSDKDLMQVVTDRVTLYDPMKDKEIGRDGVIEKWGVGPEKMIDLQALVGDSSDNVPGVPGIGPKTAAQLLDEYGTLDALLARASEIKQEKRREAIIANRDMALLSRQLVTLKTDCTLELPLDALTLQPTQGAPLIAFLKAMEFTTLTRRIAEATGTDAAAVEPAHVEVETEKARMRGPDQDAVQDGATKDAAGGETPDAGSGRLPARAVRTPSAKPVSGDGTPQAFAAQEHELIRAIPLDHDAYVIIRDEAELTRWLDAARAQGHLALDLETTSLDPQVAEIAGIALALEPGRAAYLPVGHVEGGHGGAADMFAGAVRFAAGQIDRDRALALVKPLAEDAAILKIGQNFKFDFAVLARHGIVPRSFDDTLLMSYALDAGFGVTHGMDALSEKFLGLTPIPFSAVCGTGKTRIGFHEAAIEPAARYAAEDADITLRLWRVLKPRLAAEGMATVYDRLERPLIPVLARMEERGIMVDRQILSRLSGRFAQKAAALEDEAYQIAGKPFAIGSPKQLGEILFEEMSLPGGKKTSKSGQWATDAKVLEDLAGEGHALPSKIVEWRQLTKLKSTYTDALPTYLDAASRIHTSYSLASTTTGRLSSSEPNLQNIPVRTEEGRAIRTAFIAPKGKKLLSADYSQIELRVLAHTADIPQLKKAFADGLDIHAMTASEMFGVPVQGMPPEVRRRAKAINFGIIYGISAFGLANQLAIPREEAGQYIKTYFERFPGIKEYMEATKQQARDNGFVETLFGRRIHFDNIAAANPTIRAGAERAAINAPIQGSAADIIRRAMIRMEKALCDAGLNAAMLLQVHDELIFEVDDAEVEATIPVVRKVMEDAPFPAVAMSVPLQVDARAAANWDEAH
jgi:DNA polymerase I